MKLELTNLIFIHQRLDSNARRNLFIFSDFI